MKIVIFGAGEYGFRYSQYVKHYSFGDEIVAFLDNKAVGSKTGHPIYKVKDIHELEYDFIMVSANNSEVAKQMKHQLIENGVPNNKIKLLIEDTLLMEEVNYKFNRYEEQVDQRVCWLRDFAKQVNDMSLQGAVAECGVFKGYFSFYINKYFPDKKLYLFDTFEGFSEKDLEVERSLSSEKFINSQFNNTDKFAETSEEYALRKMYHPEQCVIKKGYFPETAVEVEDKFVFVMLDMDLYQPMLAGLEFFYDKMIPGGVMLLHDYFHEELPGVKCAVEEFEKRTGFLLNKVPIGDGCSLAVIRQ